MGFSSATLQASYSIPFKAPDSTPRPASSLPSCSRVSSGKCCFSSRIGGYRSLAYQVKPRKSLVAASIGKETLASNKFNPEEIIFADSSESTCSHEKSGGLVGKTSGREDNDFLDDHKMTKVCDKLIEVFLVDKPTTTDWRRLLAFSRDWSDIRPHFFKRCQDRADSEEDPGMKQNLLRLGRKLKEIDEDVQRHNELLGVLKATPSEINQVVARRRKDFTKEFFEHFHTVVQSYYDNPTEQNSLAKLGDMCLSAVQAYDTANESIEAINAAELKFQDIINSPSLDAACRKIDNLAKKNQLDSALVLMITKAWSAAKESNLMRDEAKDILYHLYITAVGNLQRLMPKEVRIMKYLLKIEDPEERFAALKDAFTPGEELEGIDIDTVYTTPEELHTWIKTVVDAYYLSQEGSLLRHARDLMNPKIIGKLELLMKEIEKSFM